MRKFLTSLLLALFMFTVASINSSADIQFDIGAPEELKTTETCILDSSLPALPASFCQRTEELRLCEATPLNRSLVLTEFLWPMKSDIINHYNIHSRFCVNLKEVESANFT